MTIAPGTFLGSYEILGLLGAGGMGEVFRARDKRIGREVAIKVLPADMTGDANRLQRFELEARAAGGLNHPNLVTIYEFGSHEGAPFLVMELLDGATLRDLIRSSDDDAGPPRLPIRKIVDYAAQIATGLAAAHEKGIIHRDLKPENIVVTSDGRVKILDFGLAKLSGPADADGTEARTEKKNTSPGTVMGTAGYMSPEQVRGQQVDHRTDIFSFGAILYEMLSGRRAFHGDSAADTMSAILREDPQELADSRPSAPPALDRIARHCLEKNPSQRFQSAQDLAFDIAACSVESGTGERTAISRRPLRPWLLPGGLGLLIGGAIVLFASRHLVRPTEPLSFHQVTFRRGNILHARFAPDGHTIYYAAAFDGAVAQLFSSRADASETHALGITGDFMAASSKGELAVMIKKEQAYIPTGLATLATVPMSGGTPHEVLSDSMGADWSPDGKELAILHFAKNEDLMRIEWPVGHQIAVTSGANGVIRVSPDGQQVALLEYHDGAASIRVLDRGGRDSAKLGPFVSSDGFAWNPESTALILSTDSGHGETAILRCGLKGGCTTLFRAPVHIVVHDTSADGRMLIEASSARATLQIVDARTGAERDLSWLGGSQVIGISKAGDALVMWEDGTAGAPQTGIYYRKTDGSPPTWLGDGVPIALSGDGKWVLAVDVPGGSKLQLVPTGAGASRSFASPSGGVWRASFLPRSDSAIVVADDSAHVRRAYQVDLTSGRFAPVAPSLSGVDTAVVSADGKKLAALTRQGVYVVDIAAGTPILIPGLTPNDDPIAWSGDGRTLYISPKDESPPSIYVVDPATGHRTLVRRLVPADPSGVVETSTVVMTPDAQTIAYTTFRVSTSALFVVDSK